MSQKPVVTRFAPSPTGALHIGGARTALYAWAYTRQQQGKFILRIEDTDRARSSQASEEGILRDLAWLGLNWDEGPDKGGEVGPYRQSERLDLYAKYIALLKEAGKAYDDDDAVRFKMGFDVDFHDEVYGDIHVEGSQLEDFVIQKADGFPTYHFAVVVDDALMKVTHIIRGQEHLSNTAKHAALYDALAQVAKDGEDFSRPVWVHTPSIMNPDGSKMSKRDKAKVARKEALAAIERGEWTRDDLVKALVDPVTSYRRLAINLGDESGNADAVNVTKEEIESFLDKHNDDMSIALGIKRKLGLTLPEIEVEDFKMSGYLPEVLCNYISLLGWNPGDDVEQFDTDFLIEKFSFKRINKANSKFDREKLLAFNGDRLQHQMTEEQFVAAVHEYMLSHPKRPWWNDLLQERTKFDKFATAYKERSRTLADPMEQGAWLLQGPQTREDYDAKAIKKNLHKNEDEGLKTLEAFRNTLDDINPWDAPTIHTAIEKFTADQGLKNMGGIAQPLRVAITGNAVSPPIDITLGLLGRDELRKRINECLIHCLPEETA